MIPTQSLNLDPEDIRIFSGNASKELAREICRRLGIPLAPVEVSAFNDGEIKVEIGCNIRERDVYIIQSTCRPNVNQHLMELLIMLDAASRASAARITAVIPYYGYARQDRKAAGRVPISARLVADLITAAGASRVLTVDLHAGQIQGFFNIPVDNLYGAPAMVEALRCCEDISSPSDVVVVSPDAGGVRRATYLANVLFPSGPDNAKKRSNNAPELAIVDKTRLEAGKVSGMRLIGSVKDKVAIITDDIVDTAGTLISAAEMLRDKGAVAVYACVVHGVLSTDAQGRKAHEKITKSKLKKLIITDTISLKEDEKQCRKIRVASITGLLAQAIFNIHMGRSVSEIFPFIPGTN